MQRWPGHADTTFFSDEIPRHCSWPRLFARHARWLNPVCKARWPGSASRSAYGAGSCLRRVVIPRKRKLRGPPRGGSERANFSSYPSQPRACVGSSAPNPDARPPSRLCQLPPPPGLVQSSKVEGAIRALKGDNEIGPRLAEAAPTRPFLCVALVFSTTGKCASGQARAQSLEERRLYKAKVAGPRPAAPTQRS